MAARVAQIVAFGGGGFSMEAGNPLLDDYVLALAASRKRPALPGALGSSSTRPRVCFLPTASGDADHYVVRFYRQFATRCDASHVSLFRRDREGVQSDFADHLLSQDLIYVGGGNLVSLLGTWRAHGLHNVLRRAWRRGIVLCGPSAGSLCWFAEALTAFHSDPHRVQGLGLLPHSNCVHYDAEPARRAEYRRFVGDGMRPGYAVDDGAALHFRGKELARAISSRPRARAYRVEPAGGEVVETPLDVEYLGARTPELATA
jgi:peptidase E